MRSCIVAKELIHGPTPLFLVQLLYLLTYPKDGQLIYLAASR
jgi:hypothetical protein